MKNNIFLSIVFVMISSCSTLAFWEDDSDVEVIEPVALKSFKNEYSQDKYNIKIENNNYGPSKNCWENSWSFSPLNNDEKLSLENLWNKSLTP